MGIPFIVAVRRRAAHGREGEAHGHRLGRRSRPRSKWRTICAVRALEVAAIEAPRGSRVAITLTGPQDSTAPGRVRLSVRRFDAHPEEPTYTTQVAAFKAWSSATNASLRTDAIKATALADMDRAIAGLERAARRCRRSRRWRAWSRRTCCTSSTSTGASRAPRRNARRAHSARCPGRTRSTSRARGSSSHWRCWRSRRTEKPRIRLRMKR